MPRMNDSPDSSAAFYLTPEIMRASATTVTSRSRWTLMKASITGSALSDQKDTEIDSLRAKYAEDQTGKALGYNTVAAALFRALGGDSSTENSPSLDQF
jgi:hypothetical protein